MDLQQIVGVDLAKLMWQHRLFATQGSATYGGDFSGGHQYSKLKVDVNR